MSFSSLFNYILNKCISLYQYAMSFSEDRFLINDFSTCFGDNVSSTVMNRVYISFAVMIVLLIFSSDKVEFRHPIEGIMQWGNKISIFKVFVLGLIIYSIHPFYKMMVVFLGNILGADGSLYALMYEGTYINPISIMVYSYILCSLKMRRGAFQAFALGLFLFLTPCVLKYFTINSEMIAILGTGVAIAIVGLVAYELKWNTDRTYFSMMLMYFVGRFFMMKYSSTESLMSSGTVYALLRRYIAFVEIDLLISLLLLMIMFFFRIAMTGSAGRKSILIYSILFILSLGGAVYLSPKEFSYQPYYQNAEALKENGDYEGAIQAYKSCISYKDSFLKTQECEDILYGQTYEQALQLFTDEDYDGAAKLFETVGDYKDSKTKLNDCTIASRKKSERETKEALFGDWYGDGGSFLEVRESGGVSYSDASTGETKGVWTLTDNDDGTYTFKVDLDDFSYDLYAVLNDGGKTSSIYLEAKSDKWFPETFKK